MIKWHGCTQFQGKLFNFRRTAFIPTMELQTNCQNLRAVHILNFKEYLLELRNYFMFSMQEWFLLYQGFNQHHAVPSVKSYQII